MTLVQRLTLILLLLTVMVAGSSLLIIAGNARHTVNEELDQSVKTVIQLITAALVSTPAENGYGIEQSLVEHFSELQTNQSLRISIRTSGSGAGVATPVDLEIQSQAPTWFKRLVAPTSKEYHQRLNIPGRHPLDIIIYADPTDELDESWEESRTMMMAMGILSVVSLLLFAMVVKRSLSPVRSINEGLTEIESGDFSARLPEISLPELNELGQQFNRMAHHLESQQTENRRLSKEMLKIQETERRRIAQELHDELGQSITAIKALAFAQSVQEGPGQQSGQAILDVCQQMHNSVRSLMHQLRPPMLDELGLEPAIEKLVDDWNDIHESSFCALTINGSFENTDEQVRIHLYRIIQEALNNAAKHSEAENLTISLLKDDSRIQLVITDDGVGMDLSAGSHGMGLPGIRERAEACEGELNLESSAGEGLMIEITIPLAGYE